MSPRAVLFTNVPPSTGVRRGCASPRRSSACAPRAARRSQWLPLRGLPLLKACAVTSGRVPSCARQSVTRRAHRKRRIKLPSSHAAASERGSRLSRSSSLAPSRTQSQAASSAVRGKAESGVRCRHSTYGAPLPASLTKRTRRQRGKWSRRRHCLEQSERTASRSVSPLRRAMTWTVGTSLAASRSALRRFACRYIPRETSRAYRCRTATLRSLRIAHGIGAKGTTTPGRARSAMCRLHGQGASARMSGRTTLERTTAARCRQWGKGVSISQRDCRTVRAFRGAR